LTKSIALYCAEQNLDIRCNSIHPAFIDTPIIDPMLARLGGDPDSAKAKLARAIPLKRLGSADDVAFAAVYLASDEARFVTGAELKIDGGLSAR
jgi:NAD(P)-dependent dehydrogenase (short-subunit alcohol dehydrogenase family)